MSASAPFHQHTNILLDSTIFLPNTALTPSNNKNISMDSSSIVTDSILKSVPSMDKKRKLCNKACSPNSMKSMRGKREKKMKEEQKGGRGEEQAPAGYIHVRARRGQATDSHSLAERVRREKISERMKLLQALVPGCDKVSGKALMLDEIINYVKSLQHQVELLSMKLASVNPMFSDLGMDIQSFMVQHDQDFMNYSPPLPSLQEYLLSMETETYHLPESFTLIPTILPEMYASGFQQDIMGSG